MRSKALLVGAGKGMQGPWVSLEEGVWQIQSIGDVFLLLPGGASLRRKDGHIYVDGPIRLRAVVLDEYEGPAVHLDAKQVSNNIKHFKLEE